MNVKEVSQELDRLGFVVIPDYCKVDSDAIKLADALLNDESYKVGRSFKTSDPKILPPQLYFLVCNTDIDLVFKSMCPNIECQDVFITHEYKNDTMERNNWLHFDRLRCLKAMVYLSEVGDADGPFSVVPKSHKRACELRRKFANKPYEDRLNRIAIDHPELMKEPTKICGSPGTLILFDTDVFHKGGDVGDGQERKIIRSHWYTNYTWREMS